MNIIRNQYWNFRFFKKYKKCSYFYNFGRIWLVDELVLTFLSPINYPKAQFNPIILSRVIEYENVKIHPVYAIANETCY